MTNQTRIAISCIILMLLNTVDALMTMFLVPAGFAVEANPLAGYLLNTDPTLFMFTKVAGVAAACIYAVTRIFLMQTVPRYVVRTFQALVGIYIVIVFLQLIALLMFA